MDEHFHFNVVPMQSGGYTTRAVTQDDLLTAELIASTKAALAARGSWPTTVGGTGNVTLSLVVKYPRNTQTSTFIYGNDRPLL